MKYLNMIEESPLAVVPCWLLLRCQWWHSARPLQIAQHYCSVPHVSSGILLCAPHSVHLVKTVISLEHWHRLSRWLYMSYHFLISGPSFFLSCGPQKNQFFPFPVWHTWGNLFKEFRLLQKAVRNVYSQKSFHFQPAKVPKRKSNLTEQPFKHNWKGWKEIYKNINYLMN